MANQSQPISIIADVIVEVSPLAVSAPAFNQGLIVGTSSTIPSFGVNPRIRQYTSLAGMIADGFSTSSPEYIAAQIYFSQSPPQFVWIGRHDLTAIQTAIPHSGNLGTGYVVGDLIHVTQGGASNGVLEVTTIGASGTVTGLQAVAGAQGTGYAVAAALATTGGTGTALEVDITAIGETCLQAAQACRLASPNWYCFMDTTAVTADHEAIAAWVETQTGTYYFCTTSDAAVLNGTSPSLLTVLNGGGYKRTWVQYASTQSGLFPNQIYFVAAVMGVAMAANTQLAGSSFTMKFSAGVPLVGVFTEPLTLTQITNIENLGGNLYINYGGQFNVLEQGSSAATGQFFDEVLNLDVLAANIQFNLMDLLTSNPKIPQTDQGQQQLIQAVQTALAQSASTGFIAGGVWQGQTILNLTAGTALPSGYSVQSPKYSTQTSANRQARQAMPIYVALIEAGAVHSVVIQVRVQR